MANSAPRSESPQDDTNLGSGFDLNRLTAELVSLRAREGLVYKRVTDCQELMSLARIWKRAQKPEIAGLDDPSAAILLVKQALEGERPVEYRDSLKVTYGLIVDGLSRDERVRRYLELPEAQKTVHSGPSIERYSRKMAAQLAATIGSFALAQSRQPESSARPPAVNATLLPYTIDATCVRYRMKSGQLLRDILYHRTITSITGGDHTYVGHNAHYTDWRPGTHQAEAVFGCELIRSYHENGTDYYQMQFTKALAIGESFELIYRVQLSAKAAFAGFVINVPPTDIGVLTICCEFAADELPGRYWAFGGLNYFPALIRENRRQTARQHDGSRHISESWQNARAGLCYGVDWDW